MAYNGRKLKTGGHYRHYYCLDCSMYLTGGAELNNHMFSNSSHRVMEVLTDSSDYPAYPMLGMSADDFLPVHTQKTALPREDSAPWRRLAGKDFHSSGWCAAFPWYGDNKIRLESGYGVAPFPHVVDVFLIGGPLAADPPKLVVLWFWEDDVSPGYRGWGWSVYDPFTLELTGQQYTVFNNGLAPPGCTIPLAAAYDMSSHRVGVLVGNATYPGPTALAGGAFVVVDATSIYNATLTPTPIAIMAVNSMAGTEVHNLNIDQCCAVAGYNGRFVILWGGLPASDPYQSWVFDAWSWVMMAVSWGANPAYRPDGGIAMDAAGKVFMSFYHPTDPTQLGQIIVGDYFANTNVATYFLTVEGGVAARRCKGMVRAGDWLLYSQEVGSTAAARIGVLIPAPNDPAPPDWTSATNYPNELNLGVNVHNAGYGSPLCFDGSNVWMQHSKSGGPGGAGLLKAFCMPIGAITLDDAELMRSEPMPVLRHAVSPTSRPGKMCYDGVRIWCIPEHYSGAELYSVKLTDYTR